VEWSRNSEGAIGGAVVKARVYSARAVRAGSLAG